MTEQLTAGKNRRLVKWAIATVTTILLVALLLTQVSLGDIIVGVKQIPPRSLLWGLLLLTVSNAVRTFRFQYAILSTLIPFADCFFITTTYNLLTSLMPGGSGEISFLVLLKQKHNVGLGESVAVLITTRLLDLVTVIGFFAISLLWNAQALIRDSFSKFAVIMALLGVLLLGVLAKLHCLVQALRRFLQFVGEHSTVFHSFLQRTLVLIDGFWTAYRRIQSEKRHEGLLLLTITMWLINYLLIQVILQGMGIQLDISQAIFCLSLVTFSALLPIQTLAGFGLQETGWVLGGMLMIGLEKELAVAMAFVVHIVILAMSVAIAILGWTLPFIENGLNRLRLI